MAKVLIKNGLIINRGETKSADLLIKGERIERIDSSISVDVDKIIDAKGRWVIPGIIDDQVHFREPGLTHKASIYTESRAALAGGVTSYMEMPNTKPPALTQPQLEEKYTVAGASSITNYSFYMGASNENLDEVLATDPTTVCGIKVFMGSSTGNMLVDDREVLKSIFERSHMLIATHCEDEATIRTSVARYNAIDRPLTAADHPAIRSREGCYLSSSMAVDLAKQYGTRLHVLHISTKEELDLFTNKTPLTEKRITSEACVHHLFFNSDDYTQLGNKIKCNPAIKDREDQEAILAAVLDDRIDVIATDHAPHTMVEKSRPYTEAPSGLPLVQHSLIMMLDLMHRGKITKEEIIRKMCHAPADLFRVRDRGYLDEGMYADLSIVDPDKEQPIDKKDLFFKCQWSPLEGRVMRGSVDHVFVNGVRKYVNGRIINQSAGQRLLFDHWDFR